MPERMKMVSWYDPVQLAKTGVQMAASAAVGTRADFRMVESLATAPPSVGNYSDLPGVWIDYVADVGDGWDPTFAIASLLARPTLNFSAGGSPEILPAGRILIMGGDEAYPVASRKEYECRTEAPYAAAFKRRAENDRPDLYSLPGNHDWYDGLVAFVRTFCQGRSFGGLPTKQTRSYFALRLPKRWWLLGVDLQLESDIDKPQLDYFRSVVAQMGRGDRVILATPEPDWVLGTLYDEKLEKNLVFLEDQVINPSGAEVRLRLAGDLHHYRRHSTKPAEDPAAVHCISAGGGGAFLHPTHTRGVRKIDYGTGQTKLSLTLGKEFPARWISRLLTFKNLLFPLLNPTFGFLTGIIYLLLSWVMPQDFTDLPLSMGSFPRLISQAAGALARTPSATPFIVFLVLAFVLFTDTHKIWYRIAGGAAHALVHLIAALVAAWIADGIARGEGMLPGSPSYYLANAAIILGIGYLLGGVVMGVYLLVSLNVFGRHANEAFSSLRIKGYKNFLRLHIDETGALTIYPIGITRVPRVAGEEDADRLKAIGIEPKIRVN